MLYTEITITLSQNPCLNPLQHQFIIHVQLTTYCDVTMYNILIEGSEKATRAGVNEIQSKFIEETSPMS
jgi:hypothetical protein